MKEKKPSITLRHIFMGKRYLTLESINDQARYMTMNAIFLIAIFPLVILGFTMLPVDKARATLDFFIAFLCLISLVMLRSEISLNRIPIFPVTVFGAYCLFLLYQGDLNLWSSAWLFAFPPIVFFLCQFRIGLIESILAFLGAVFLLYAPVVPFPQSSAVRLRVLGTYVLIMGITIIYDIISVKKDQKETKLKTELAQERDVIQTMKDNIQQGIFLMDSELRILPQYSKPLITILSYYDAELAGKNFLDILSSSLDAKQLNTMKGYFAMFFAKSKSKKVLESANPISELEYRVDDRFKYLTTKFHLVEQGESEPVIIGILQDITREKEFERELLIQKEVQEMEMKNMFDVIQIDPLVFNDFIEDTESNFTYINTILKDRLLTPKQVLTKFFQNIHAVKANAMILGLETFGNRLHALEDEIKNVSNYENITVEDILGLALKLETIMQEKDNYTKIIRQIEAFKTTNQVDTILIHSLTKAVEKVSQETHKKVDLKAGQVDIGILESKLRKPIKDILFQCVRNSIYHGIEPVDERIQKNKKPQSLLVFTVKNVDGIAEVTFSDDGRGLDWEKIKKRYLTLHPDAKAVNKKILLSAIFTPEFSTSEETSIIAGRGVGLSLVKDLVKENAGTIKVDSSESGLTFKFTFPIPKSA